MFTFSRRTNQITIVLAVFAGLFFASVSGAQAASVRMTPAKQTITVGHIARGIAAGRRCSMRLPSRKVIRVNGKRRWAWRATRSGRFQVKMRCGRKVSRVAVLVKPRPVSASNFTNQDPNLSDSDPVDGQVDNGSDPVTPVAPKEPTASMNFDQLNSIYSSDCKGSAKRAATDICQRTINYMVGVTYEHYTAAECMKWMFRNCDAKHPYGNPYDTRNGGGICSDWAYFKRPDLVVNIDKTWFRAWLNSGLQDSFPQIDWGNAAQDSPTDAWTTWARRAGYHVSLTPKAGALMVSYNHVAYVERLVAPTASELKYGFTAGGFEISEMNVNGHRGVVHSMNYSASPTATKQMGAFFVY
jgi:hypothetical protein